MKIGIIQFPGSNCERETKLAVQRAGMEPVEFLWNQDREILRSLDGYIIVGGFSYEDRSRAGIIAALDPVMLEIAAQSEKGKPILGICNGAQILVETGLVPGLENNKPGIVLAENKRLAQGKILGTGFYNAWIDMRVSDTYQRNAFTRHLTQKNILHVPVAHGEGRFVIPNALLQEMTMHGLNVFQYCDANGLIDEHFPVNPNGSVANIAAVSNKNGNVMAMMPHPERTPNGDPIFNSMRDYIADGKVEQGVPLMYYPRTHKMPSYQVAQGAHESVVELIITDNQALTVQNALQQLGMPVSVKRYTHWEIFGESDAVQEAMESGVLYNPRKEKNTPPARAVARGSVYEHRGSNKEPRPSGSGVLVRSKDDIIGAQKLQTLNDYFGIKKIDAIKHSVLWEFSSDDENIQDLLSRIMNIHIIANPFAHDCYHY